MSIKFYPVQDTEFTKAVSADRYRVLVNGNEAALDAARVSAVPYNRRWPGHQRTLDQTETVQFLSMSANEPLVFEIFPPKPFQSVVIRPRSCGISAETTDNGTIKFTMEKPSYVTVEPYGRNNALHLFVDNYVNESAVLSENSDVLYYGPGIHEAGLIELKTNQTLYIDEGAVVYACISARDAQNIRICGHGILDNSHNVEKIFFEANVENNDSAVNNAERQHTIQLEYCTGISIEDITIRDSLVYNIRPIGCCNLTIRDVKIIGCWRYNSDGIDMHNCENVLIDHCFIRTYDDSVCVKGFDCYYEGNVEETVRKAMYRNGKSYDIFRNVTVKNCIIWNDWGKCFEIGAETRAEEIYDITFEDSDIIHVTGPVLDCCNVDYADVHDIVYRNINIEMDETIPAPQIQKQDSVPYTNSSPGYVPNLICVEVVFHHEYSAGGMRRGINRELKFENINVIGNIKPACWFNGYSESAGCKNIIVRNITVNGRRLSSETDAGFSLGRFCNNICYKEQ